MRLFSDVAGYARLSRDGQYRYWLAREASHPPGSGPHDLWVMLNPSTGTAEEDDPTLRLIQRISFGAGAHGVYVVNLFALRSSKPETLRMHPDPVGPLNDRMIDCCVARSDRIIEAWGSWGKLANRGLLVDRTLRASGKPLFVLGHTKAGQPKHPRALLYEKDQVPSLFPSPDLPT